VETTSAENIGSEWDGGRRVLTTRLSGVVTVADVDAWKTTLTRAVARIPAGTTFKVLLDLHGYESADIEAHKAMRNVVPLLLASHGMRPAFIDLFDEMPEIQVSAARGSVCTAFANVHHDREKMDTYRRRIGRVDQQFFTLRREAESWLASLP
jgi:hypothetical protein